MRRRTRLFVVLAVFVAGFSIVGSGAFSTVTAERTVSVDVAGDDAALLELDPHSGPNGAYAGLNDGQLEIDFDAVSADGINQNASTTLENVFNVTNSGAQSTSVYITKTGENDGLVTFNTSDGTRIDGGSGNAVSVGTGETIEVTIYIDTTGQNLASGDTLLDSITVHAEA
jgi:hypothetical protein